MNRTGFFLTLATVIIFLSFPLKAQQTKTSTKTTVKTKSKAKPTVKKPEVIVKKVEPPEQPLATADKMPKFLGGDEAIERYFVQALASKKIISPAGITLNLVIDKLGKVKDAVVKTGYRRYENGMHLQYPEIDKAILEAALAMPAWEPALNQGKPVSVQQEVYFSLMSPEEAKAQSEKILTFVEQQPQFPGGEAKMLEFINANLKYPADAQQNKQEGLVIVQFVITRFGEITEPSILKGFSESANNETLRLVRAMPRWVPGKQNGRPVAVRFTLPVRFKL